MEKIRVLVVGYGNVGRGVLLSLANQVDMEVVGIASRSVGRVKKSVKDIPVVDINNPAEYLALKPDVAILCGGSKNDLPQQGPEIVKYLNTVDSFDEHHRIVSLRRELDVSAKVKKTVSIIGAGWDPGTDSLIRALMKVVSLTGHTTTTFGGNKGGRSMGHTVQVKSIAGVKDAVALTLANGRGKQKRKVYVELEKGADITAIEKAILADDYFKNEPTEIMVVKNIDKYNTLQHSAEIERTGMQANQMYTVSGNNPEFTANIMVSSVRACMNAYNKEDYGVYTFIERPIIDYLAGNSLDDKLEGY